jgi:hypothetical protein
LKVVMILNDRINNVRSIHTFFAEVQRVQQEAQGRHHKSNTAENSSQTDALLKWQYLGNLRVQCNKRIQFISWVNVLGSCVHGHRIESYLSHKVLILLS